MALPSTPLLDDFSRPDENPLSNQGRWVVPDTDFPGPGQLVSQRLIGPGDSTSTLYYWSPLPSLRETEAWATVANAQAGTTFWIATRLRDVGGTAALDGYLFQSTIGTVTIRKLVDGGFVTLSSRSFARAAGDVLVFRSVGNVHTAYAVRGISVIQIGSSVDSDYADGYVGVGLFGNVGTLQNFGGGALGVPGPARAPRALAGWSGG